MNKTKGQELEGTDRETSMLVCGVGACNTNLY